MEILGLLADGVLTALEPANLMICFIGVVIGLFVGAVVLSVGYKLYIAWLADTEPAAEQAAEA